MAEKRKDTKHKHRPCVDAKEISYCPFCSGHVDTIGIYRTLDEPRIFGDMNEIGEAKYEGGLIEFWCSDCDKLFYILADEADEV